MGGEVFIVAALASWDPALLRIRFVPARVPLSPRDVAADVDDYRLGRGRAFFNCRTQESQADQSADQVSSSKAFMHAGTRSMASATGSGSTSSAGLSHRSGNKRECGDYAQDSGGPSCLHDSFRMQTRIFNQLCFINYYILVVLTW